MKRNFTEPGSFPGINFFFAGCTRALLGRGRGGSNVNLTVKCHRRFLRGFWCLGRARVVSSKMLVFKKLNARREQLVDQKILFFKCQINLGFCSGNTAWIT